jgi:hypothetical protein
MALRSHIDTLSYFSARHARDAGPLRGGAARREGFGPDEQGEIDMLVTFLQGLLSGLSSLLGSLFS